MARKDRELREIEAAREAAARKLSDLEAELVLAGEQFPEALNQPSDNLVAGLFAELAALLEEKMTLSAIYQPAWPRLVELEEEIAEVREVILEAERRRDSGVPGGSDIWAKRKEIYQQQIDLRLQMASLEIQAGAIERERKPSCPAARTRQPQVDRGQPQARSRQHRGATQQSLRQGTRSARKYRARPRHRGAVLRAHRRRAGSRAAAMSGSTS